MFGLKLWCNEARKNEFCRNDDKRPKRTLAKQVLLRATPRTHLLQPDPGNFREISNCGRKVLHGGLQHHPRRELLHRRIRRRPRLIPRRLASKSSLPTETAPRRAFGRICAFRGVGSGLARRQHLLDQLRGAQPDEVFAPGSGRRRALGGPAAAIDRTIRTVLRGALRPGNSRGPRPSGGGGVADGTASASEGRKLGVTAGRRVSGRCIAAGDRACGPGGVCYRCRKLLVVLVSVLRRQKRLPDYGLGRETVKQPAMKRQKNKYIKKKKRPR